EGLVVGADVTAAPAVRDRRTAAHVRFQHGQAGGRVDECVACSEPLRHPVGETFDAYAAVVREALREPAADCLVAAAEADDGDDAVEGERRLHRTREVSDTPPSAGDQDDLPDAR